jgi:hypothetical protein
LPEGTIMNLDARELLHHILPATFGSGIMLSLGEHFLFSVATGITIWIVTHALSAGFKKVFK